MAGVLPNFFIGGVSSGGTSFLATAMKQHPEIYMPENIVPEPHFFFKSWEYSQGINYYSKRWFENAESAQAIGEKSSSYLFGGKVVAERIAALVPDAKFIFSLRNPIERAWASYRFTVMNGLEPLSFEAALECEAKRATEHTGEWAEIQPFNYTGRGLYAVQLEAFLKCFPRENIQILKFEDMSADPQVVLSRLFEFLGVDPEFRPTLSRGTFSSLEVKDAALQKQLRDYFGDRFALIIKAVREGTDPYEHMDSPDERDLFEQFLDNLKGSKGTIMPQTRDYLRNVFRDDMNRLRDIVSFRIEDWN